MRISRTYDRDRLLGSTQRRTLVRFLIIASAVVAAVVTIGSINAARSLRDTYGHRVEVWVARSDLPVGHVLTNDDIDRRELPAALIPAGLAPDPATRTVIEPIVTGEPILDRRLSGSTVAGIDALIGSGSRAITIERDPTTPPVEPGDRVDLYAPAVRGGVVRVARRARVLAVDDRAITVAITENETPAATGASLEKILSVVLLGSG